LRRFIGSEDGKSGGDEICVQRGTGKSKCGSYTLGHTIDNASGLRVSSRIDGGRTDRGNSEQDIRQRYVMSYLWEFPLMKPQTGVLGHILGGWGLSGVNTFQTGPPFDITEPDDRCLCDSGNQRPDFVGGTIQFFDPRSTSSVPGRANSWFDGTGGGTATAATNPFFRFKLLGDLLPFSLSLTYPRAKAMSPIWGFSGSLYKASSSVRSWAGLTWKFKSVVATANAAVQLASAWNAERPGLALAVSLLIRPML
jgi:hypothetical protein